MTETDPYAPGTTFTIQIDGDNLTRLKGEYANLIASIEKRLGQFTWSPTASAYISGPFPLYLGGSGFEAGNLLSQNIETARGKLVTRLGTTYTNAYQLRWGLEFILEDSKALEELNGMSADEFAAFIPTTTPTPPGATPGAGK